MRRGRVRGILKEPDCPTDPNRARPDYRRTPRVTLYQNTPTVVVVLVSSQGGLLMIRHALAGAGQGKLALPGGYQMLGQTWQEAETREVLECG